MTLADSVRHTVARVLADESVLANADTIVRSPGSTIVPTGVASADLAARLTTLLEGAGTVKERLRIEGLLGEGGMGVVRLAEQRTLGRKVAVKTVKPEIATPLVVEKLLHEAWVTGHVQHPSVVPIHDVILDEHGRPAIILQRIEGQAWEALMFDERAVKRRFGADDLLEWNLQILMQVTQAIAFAHSLGLVHRDLKPENVMIGEFGEVYVVDWGLAVAVRPDADPRLPRLRPNEAMAGTPAYMAPEMLGGHDVPIGRATDVYLLGAILFEIATGLPPHGGSTLQEIVASIALSQPEIPEHVSPELARIIRRALDPDPHARFENVVQLRLALAGFLKHQSSRRLADEASRRHRQIEATIAAAEAGEKIDEATLQSTYAECRFGYQQALVGWPENDAARTALRELVVRFVEFALVRGEPRVAAATLAGFEDSLSELARRVEHAVREKDREQRKLEALSRELDPEIGRRTRTFLAVAAGGIWTLSPQLRHLGIGQSFPEADALVVLPMLFLALGTLLFLWARETMTKTAINRFLVAFTGLVLFAQILIAWTATAEGIDAVVTYRQLFVLWALAAATIAFVAQLRMLTAAVGYLVGFFVLARHPELRNWVASACHLLTTLVAVIIWAPGNTLTGRALDRVDPGRNESMATFRPGRRGGRGDGAGE